MNNINVDCYCEVYAEVLLDFMRDVEINSMEDLYDFMNDNSANPEFYNKISANFEKTLQEKCMRK
jgi:hypothetical protein